MKNAKKEKRKKHLKEGKKLFSRCLEGEKIVTEGTLLMLYYCHSPRFINRKRGEKIPQQS